MEPIVVSSRVVIPAAALTFRAVRASGPGGQNVNKVSSKVELRVELDAIVGLTLEQRRRLESLARRRLDGSSSGVSSPVRRRRTWRTRGPRSGVSSKPLSYSRKFADRRNRAAPRGHAASRKSGCTRVRKSRAERETTEPASQTTFTFEQ